VTNMGQMFSEAQSFNQDISGWDTSNVESMQGMFDCGTNSQSTFNLGQPSGAPVLYSWPWNVSKVTDMSFMFRSALNFNQDISSWKVSSVTNMQGMFTSTAFFSQDISGWDVSKVENMDSMFFGALVFDQNIRGWDVLALTDLTHMFGGATAMIARYGTTSSPDYTIYFGTSQNQYTPSVNFFQRIPTPHIFEGFSVMPNKTPYTPNGTFAMARLTATPAMLSSGTPYKQYKTQNLGGTDSVLLRRKSKAALGDATITNASGVTIIPNFERADPNTVNSSLARARNIGGAVPRRVTMNWL